MTFKNDKVSNFKMSVDNEDTKNNYKIQDIDVNKHKKSFPFSFFVLYYFYKNRRSLR